VLVGRMGVFPTCHQMLHAPVPRGGRWQIGQLDFTHGGKSFYLEWIKVNYSKSVYLSFEGEAEV